MQMGGAGIQSRSGSQYVIHDQEMGGALVPGQFFQSPAVDAEGVPDIVPTVYAVFPGLCLCETRPLQNPCLQPDGAVLFLSDRSSPLHICSDWL